MKLANGVASIPELLQRGVRVGLGTDSVMTNNNLDMFEEMRQAGLDARKAVEEVLGPDLGAGA